MEIHVIDMSGNQPKETAIKLPNLPKWTMAEEIGYEPKTTFWDDFSIAELYGDPTPIHGIVDTYWRAFKEWKHDVKYIAELSLVLNHKGCFWYNVAEEREDKRLTAISSTYFNLWENLNDWANENLNEEDYAYYFRITD